jgi:hypothetical protein
MPSWIFWVIFLLVGAGAVAAAKWLDDRERRRAPRASDPPRSSTAPHDRT